MIDSFANLRTRQIFGGFGSRLFSQRVRPFLPPPKSANKGKDNQLVHHIFLTTGGFSSGFRLDRSICWVDQIKIPPVAPGPGEKTVVRTEMVYLLAPQAEKILDPAVHGSGRLRLSCGCWGIHGDPV